MSIFRASTLHQSNRTSLSGIDVAIIASPYIALPLAELPTKTEARDAPSQNLRRIIHTESGSGRVEKSSQKGQNRGSTAASRQNLLDFILHHLAAAGAKRATICIGPDARGIWTDREYRQYPVAQTETEYQTQNLPNFAHPPTPNKLRQNYTAELSWALSDLAPQTERKWPINLDWAVDWRGFGNLALLSMALPMMRSNPILVVCGDRFQPIDFSGFLAKHRRGGEQVTLLCREADAADLTASEKLHQVHRAHLAQATTGFESESHEESLGELLGEGDKLKLDAQSRVISLGTPQDKSSDFKYLLSGMYLFEHDYLTALCKFAQHTKHDSKFWSIERDIMSKRDAGSYAAYVDTTPIFWPDVEIEPAKTKKRERKSDKIIAFPTETTLKPRLTAARNM